MSTGKLAARAALYDASVVSRSLQEIEKLRRLRSRAAGDQSINSLVSATADDVKRTQKKLGELIEIWQELLPEQVASQTSLTSLRGGVLHIAVESSSIAYELDRMLRDGLLNQLRSRYRGTLIRVKTRLEEAAAEPASKLRSSKRRAR